MRKFAIFSVCCLLSAPAAASIVVVGNTGKGCYEAARAGDSSWTALNVCNIAFGSVMEPRDVVATHVNRGIVRLNRGDIRGAVMDFDTAMALDPDQPESYLNKGAATLRADGDPNEALALFDEALRKNTIRPELAYFGRAIANEIRGDLTAAYRDYRRAEQAAPNWSDPKRELKRFRVEAVRANM